MFEAAALGARRLMLAHDFPVSTLLLFERLPLFLVLLVEALGPVVLGVGYSKRTRS